jgi:hypothetical protein
MRLWGTVCPRTVWHIPPTGMTAKKTKGEMRTHTHTHTLGKDKGQYCLNESSSESPQGGANRRTTCANANPQKAFKKAEGARKSCV